MVGKESRHKMGSFDFPSYEKVDLKKQKKMKKLKFQIMTHSLWDCFIT